MKEETKLAKLQREFDTLFQIASEMMYYNETGDLNVQKKRLQTMLDERLKKDASKERKD